MVDMLQREGIIPSLHSHEDLMTSQQSFMTVCCVLRPACLPRTCSCSAHVFPPQNLRATRAQAFSTRQRQVINILGVACALFVCMLPGTLRALPSTLYRTGVCHTFFASEGPNRGGLTAAAVCYVIIGFIHTLLCELFLVRLYVAYARISRYFAKFTVRPAVPGPWHSRAHSLGLSGVRSRACVATRAVVPCRR